MYLLDIIRTTPPDLNSVSDPLALLRPELLSEYIQHLRAKKRMQLRQQQKQAQLKQQRQKNTAVEVLREEDFERILR